MRPDVDILFSPLELKNVTLPNRIVRSATFEGCGDERGRPRPELGAIYRALARGGVGSIITGFAFISVQGRAMHPGQTGIDEDGKIAPWRRIVKQTRDAGPEVKLFMQIAHTGRQTRSVVTGSELVGPSSKKCTYFRQPVRPLGEEEVGGIVDDFAAAAWRVREAGFDGVQVHGAHGYLIHQFLSGWTNTRADRWGDKPLFLAEVVGAIRERCGADFPVLVKLSGADDNPQGVRIPDVVEAVKRLDPPGVDALEISYGTMEFAMNIFRGGLPAGKVLEVNPLFTRYPMFLRKLWKRLFLPRRKRMFRTFEENYNVDNAVRIKKETGLPVITVGGIRSVRGMADAISGNGLDGVALCRPLIAEPDLPGRLREGRWTQSSCVNCNLCAVHCDSEQVTRCHKIREVAHEDADR
ncbi:MAG: NADH:flavin oxidoreductase [Planctomycetota bacterium]|jgi:2,4-dienoyl-CoA reductase-like NADH-dependent reductase (Old Yellow Enzyme family)